MIYELNASHDMKRIMDRRSARAPVAGIAFVLALALNALAWSQSTASPPQGGASDNGDAAGEFAAGHGSFSFRVSDLLDHGDFQGPAGSDTGQLRFQAIELGANYFIADGWEVHANIPFSDGKASAGNQQHPQIPCPPPGGTFADCVVIHVDDGKYHGTWADWDFGVNYHSEVGDGYYLTSSLDVYVPSHNYQYYGSTVVGQRLTKYGVGIALDHQFDFSNFYYGAHYQYVIMPRTLGFDLNYNDFSFDLGYFISPRLSVRVITDLKVGHGVPDAVINPTCCQATPIWEQHDRLRLQNHGSGGAGVDYAFNERWRASAALIHSFWGQSNAAMLYGVDFKLTRSF